MIHALALVGWSLSVATALGLGVWLLGRTSWLRQRPALCHALWLLVLVKLVVPSFVTVAVLPVQSVPQADEIQIAPSVPAATIGSESAASGISLPAAKPATATLPPDGASGKAVTARAFSLGSWRQWLWVAPALSLGVSCLLALLAILECRKVQLLVRSGTRRLGRAAELLREVADSFQVRNPPRVLVVDANLTPMLWGALRHSAIILPRQLVDALDDDQIRSILAHELAHFVRRDHWANTFAFCVTTLVWWNPVAWVARRQLAEAAEASCDAMVVERLSGSRKCYAQTLLRVVDFVVDLKPRRLAVAVTFGESSSLRRRFEMLADSRVTPRVSRIGWALLLLGAATSMLLPARAEQPAAKPIASIPAVADVPTDNAKATDAADAGESQPEPATPAARLLAQASAEKKPGQSINGFGTVLDPDGDCQFKEENGRVTIVVPNSWHDLTHTETYSKLNAPRILQDTKGDFSLEDEVEAFELPKDKGSSGGAHSFVSSGLLVWQDDDNFIRMDRAAVEESPFVWVERFQDGKSVTQQGFSIANKNTHLRVTRKGDTFTFETSEDRKTWVRVHGEEAKLAKALKVGVLAINSTTGQFSVKLKDLKLSRNEPKDGSAQAGWPMRVLVIDEATRRAIASPRVSVQLGDKTTSYAGNASGEVAITLPNRAPAYCYLRVRAAGYAPMRAFWSNRAGQPPDEMPESFTFAMSRAIKVGGRVIDEEGEPVTGATVYFSAGDHASLTGRRAESSFYDEEYTTDDEGRWQSDLAPPKINNGSIRVDHPDYARVSEHWSVDDQIEELRGLTHTWTLRHCFAVRGRVTDPDGKPVAGAVLAIGQLNNYPDGGPFPKTDAEGNYEFTRMGPSAGWPPNTDPRLTITALKPGLAPMMQRIDGWEPDADPAARYADRTIDFQLERGRTLRIRVVDGAGRGIANATVHPDDWNGTRPFMVLNGYGVPQKTNRDGVWEWTWAPPRDEIKYDAYCRGYMDVRDRVIAATEDETDVTITLKRPQTITGRVVDAVTRKPIDSFVVQKGFEGFNDKPDGVYWALSEDTRGRNGQYTKSITMPPSGGSYRYRVLAEGYEPQLSQSVKFDEGEVKLDFELRPTKVKD